MRLDQEGNHVADPQRQSPELGSDLSGGRIMCLAKNDVPHLLDRSRRGCLHAIGVTEDEWSGKLTKRWRASAVAPGMDGDGLLFGPRGGPLVE